MKLFWMGFLFVFMVSCSQKSKKAEIQNVPEIPTEWKYFDYEGFSIRYPQSWEIQKDLDGVVFCLLSAPASSTDLFRENVNLVIEELTKEVTLDKYAFLSLKNVRNKYRIADERKYSMDGQEYYHLILKEKDHLYLEQNYFIKGKKAYILTFAYEPGEKEEIKTEGDKIMKSFRIK